MAGLPLAVLSEDPTRAKRLWYVSDRDWFNRRLVTLGGNFHHEEVPQVPINLDAFGQGNRQTAAFLPPSFPHSPFISPRPIPPLVDPMLPSLVTSLFSSISHFYALAPGTSTFTTSFALVALLLPLFRSFSPGCWLFIVG